MVFVMRDLASGGERELYRTGPDGFQQDDFREQWEADISISPDGRELAFRHMDRPGGFEALRVIPTEGGEPRELFRVVKNAPVVLRVHAWTRDGRYLLFSKHYADPETWMVKSELWRIRREGGTPEKLDIEVDGVLRHLRIHPDGRRIAFTVSREIDENWVMENVFPLKR